MAIRLLALLLGLLRPAAAAADGVSVLLNGGFEEAGADDAQEAPHWQLSVGAALEDSQIRSGVLAAEGEAWARLSAPGAWLEQASSAGGEGRFELSLWARPCPERTGATAAAAPVELVVTLDGAAHGCGPLRVEGAAWSRVSCVLEAPAQADDAPEAEGVLRLAVPAGAPAATAAVCVDGASPREKRWALQTTWAEAPPSH